MAAIRLMHLPKQKKDGRINPTVSTQDANLSLFNDCLAVTGRLEFLHLLFRFFFGNAIFLLNFAH